MPMNRRQFFKSAAAVATIPLVAKLPAPVLDEVMHITSFEQGVAPIMPALGNHGTRIAANFSAALWPGVDKWFASAYSNMPDEGSNAVNTI